MRINLNRKTILVVSLRDISKELKSARTKAYYSTCLQWKGFEIHTGKLQGNESVLFAQTMKKNSLESDQNNLKQILYEDVG